MTNMNENKYKITTTTITRILTSITLLQSKREVHKRLNWSENHQKEFEVGL